MITRIMQDAIIDRENIFLIMDLFRLGSLELWIEYTKLTGPVLITISQDIFRYQMPG